jgi:hypothetical protein
MIKTERVTEEFARKRQRQEDDSGIEKKEEEKELVEYLNNSSTIQDFEWCKHREDQVREGKRERKSKWMSRRSSRSTTSAQKKRRSEERVGQKRGYTICQGVTSRNALALTTTHHQRR